MSKPISMMILKQTLLRIVLVYIHELTTVNEMTSVSTSNMMAIYIILHDASIFAICILAICTSEGLWSRFSSHICVMNKICDKKMFEPPLFSSIN